MKITRRAAATATALIVLGMASASCSSNASNADNKPQTQQASGSPSGSATAAATSPAAAASSSAPAAALDAPGIVAKLSGSIPTVKLTVTYDPTTDPNKRMGRPHQYTSKAMFDDTRVSSNPKAGERAKDRNDIPYGGTAEVFSTPDDAEAWIKYIDRLSKAAGGALQPDYYYRSGPVVLRVSYLMTPAQAKEYETAIS